MAIQRERSWPSAPARPTFEWLMKAYGIPRLCAAGSCRSLPKRYKHHATGNGHGNGQSLIEDCQNCHLWSFHRMLQAYMASLLQLNLGSFFCLPFTVAEAAKVAPRFWRSAPLVLCIFSSQKNRLSFRLLSSLLCNALSFLFKPGADFFRDKLCAKKQCACSHLANSLPSFQSQPQNGSGRM